MADRLVIANEVAELRRMTQWLQGSGAAAEIPKDLIYRLDVCANEAVTNIISYAYDDTARHDIALELSRTANGACLIIRDDGRPFNVLDVPAHERPANLAQAGIGGLGVHLIRTLMTRCDYRREGGLNVLSLEAQGSSPTGNA